MRRRSLVQIAMESPLVARIYESWLWRRSPLLWAAFGISFAGEQARVLAAARLRGGETVLDLGCGTGIYTRPLARAAAAGRVVGLDLSPAMLRQAAARARDVPSLSLVRGDARALPLPDGRVDVVVCCAAFHLFPDVTSVVAEVRRVLTPGGRFIVAAFRRQEGWLADVTASLRREVGTTSFTLADLDARFRRAGFVHVRPVYEGAGWLIVAAEVAA